MAKEKHPKFIEYTKFIVNHQNYKGIPYDTKDDGTIKWVATGKSKMGQKRTSWWDKKRKELKIPKTTGWKSTTALANHPTKKKPCALCGQIMSLEYVYLNKYAYKQLNNIKKLHGTYDELSDIRNVIPEVITELDKKGFKILADIFKIPDKIPKKIDNYIEYVINKAPNNKKCGPGAMSNCPDRLDGFHTYNRCCRSTEDTGRHKENLRRYTNDRRAYEHWTDGNWKAADRLMAEYNKHGVSADHIGPISLGFCHTPFGFQPMTVSEQATKNNRMTYNDVKKLIKIENKGHKVVSWHSKYIWDELKKLVNSNLEAKIMSNYMRKNMHFVLSSFALLHVKGLDDFLKYLLKPNLKHSYYDYKYKGFNPEDGSYSERIEIPLNTKNQKNNANRYIRIAFESLEEYIDKDNRNIDDENILKPTKNILNKTIKVIRNNNYSQGKKLLKKAFRKKAKYLKPEFLKDIKNRNY